LQLRPAFSDSKCLFDKHGQFYNLNNGRDCNYKWEVTNGEIVGGTNASPSIYEGPGINGITVKWNNVNGSGTVKVTTGALSNVKGCTSCPVLTQTKTIPIKYLGSPGDIKINGAAYSGSYQLGCGTAAVTVSVDPATNATNYAWSVPSGWTVSGSGPSVTVTPHPNTSGVIRVTASRNDVPDLTTSSQLHISRPLPVINTVSQADVTFCNSGQTLSVGATGTNADQFRWEPGGGVTVNGSSAAVILTGNVTIQATSTGTYKVQAYSTVCQAASDNYITKNVYYGPPATPTGTVNGDVQKMPNVVPNGAYLVLYLPNGQYTYNWAITNGTGWLYPGGGNSANATPNPFIRVEGKATNACGSSSTSFYLSNQQQTYTASPNPATSKLTVQFAVADEREILPDEIKLYKESNGKEAKSVKVKEQVDKKPLKDSNKVDLDVKDLSRGTYYLHVINGAEVVGMIRVILN
jgi:hypothetical protein